MGATTASGSLAANFSICASTLDRAELREIFTRLCAQVAQDLQRRRYVGRTIGIKLRFDDFRTVTRDMTIAQPTADAAEIQKAARACLKRVPLERKLRLLRVRVSSLSAEDALPAGPPPPDARRIAGTVSGCR